MPSQIRTKAEYYRLWQAGALGNRVRMWNRAEDVKDCSLVTIRYKEAGSPFCRYDIPADRLISAIEEFKSRGAKEELMTFNESTRDEDIRLQGEVMEDTTGTWQLHYSTARVKMRDALKAESRNASGLAAREIIRKEMDPASWEDLKALMEEYPQHVVEFGCYSRDVGMIPGRNTIFWEVRKF